MEQIGTVVDLKDTIATIIIKRNSMCGENCASCGSCVQNKFKIICNNTIGAKLHDSVIIKTDDTHVLLSAFVIYIMPVLLMIASYVLLDTYVLNKAILIILSFVTLILFYAILNRLDHILTRKIMKKTRMIKIVGQAM